MKIAVSALLALALAASATSLMAQDGPPGGGRRPAPVGPLGSDKVKATYIRLGNDASGMLYEPVTPNAKSRIGLVLSHPNRSTFNEPEGREMAARGYRMIMVEYRGDTASEEGLPEEYLPSMSRAIAYLRGLPGTQKVVIVGHSGGGHLIPLYENVAEHGPSACQGKDLIIPCKAQGIEALQKPDGMILLDSTLGSFHPMSSVDPAYSPKGRIAALDMFTKKNGYDENSKGGTYSDAFAKRFYAAQSARNDQIVNGALARLHVLDAGKSAYSDDEPFVVRGMGVRASGARLYQPDPTFAGHTKVPHTLLKADGTNVEQIVTSVRPPEGGRVVDQLRSLNLMTQNTTVRRFLANSAIRTDTKTYAIAKDEITGVDWHSSYNSTPSNVEGVTVPSLILAMSCHYLVVPDELIFNHMAAKDKTFAVVEGAVHVFTPCKPQYGDTVKRTFDYVDAWLSKDGRF